MADQAKTIQMIIAGVAGPGPLQFLQTAWIRAETDEMNAICEACFHIIEIVADVDNAVLGQAGCGDGAGQDFALVAAAIGPKGVGGNMMPEACVFQAKFGGAEEICGGDADLRAAVKILQKLTGAGNGNGFNGAIGQAAV